MIQDDSMWARLKLHIVVYPKNQHKNREDCDSPSELGLLLYPIFKETHVNPVETTKDSWKRDDTEKEKELFSTILSHRKDLRDASMAREQDGDMETRLSRLETEIESFYSRIRQTFVKPNEHQQDIDELERQVDRAQTEYIEIVEA